MYSLFPLPFTNTNILTEKSVNVGTIDGLLFLYKKKSFVLLIVNDGYGIFTMNYFERKKSGEADG